VTSICSIECSWLLRRSRASSRRFLFQ